MNNLKITVILLIIFATILVCAFRPKHLKRVVIGNFNAVLVQENQQTAAPKVENHQTAEKITKKKGENPKKTIQEIVSNIPKHEIIKQNPNPQPQKQAPNQIQTQKQTKSNLTAEEQEIIAWNKWRSDLQNQVMRDSKIRAPIGTVFKFSFTVDKFGTISNLKVWSLNPDYTPVAVRVIKPIILSYQGQGILNFPPESKRVVTNVEGKFTIWYQSGYSTPSDYSDYERVK